MNRDALTRRAAFVLVAALVALAWSNGLDGPFVYDDKVEVVGNRTIRMLEEWRAVAGYNVSRPLLIFSYAWNFDRFGFDPFGYHVTNLVVHVLAAGAALMMAGSVGRLFGVARPQVAAALAVAAWAVHPMVTEAVTYTTGRSESLCGLFVFLSIHGWALGLAEERQGRPGWPWRLGGLLALLGAVTTKEVGAMLPFALLALEVMAPPQPAPVPWTARLRRVRWGWMALFAALMVGAAWARLQHAGTLLPREVERAWAVQLFTGAAATLSYLRLWVFPVDQTLFHHLPDVDPTSARGLGVAVLWGLVLVAGVAWGWRRPAAGWALLAAAFFLMPGSSIVPLKENMAEHRAYQTGLYLALAVAWSLRGAAARWGALAAGLLVVPLLIATRARNTVWSSEVALWEEATTLHPEAADAWYGLGDALRFDKRFSDAETAYNRAVALNPSHLDAWNNLGIARAEVGDAAGAREAWSVALRERPSYCKAHNNLGSLAYRRQEWDLAVTELRSTLAYCSEDPVAHYLLGNIYYGPRRDWEKALVHYQTLEAVAPRFDQIEVVKERILEMTW